MKIAIAVQYFRTGGMETFILRLSRYLISMGHDVTVIATYYDKGNMWNELKKNKIKSLHFNMYEGFSPVTNSIKLAKYFSNNKYDIILVNNEKYTQAILNMLPDNVIVIPIIHIDADFAYRLGCANAHAWNAIVGVCPKVIETIKRHTPDSSVVQIMYGVEMPTIDHLQNRLEFDKQLKLLFVGRLEHLQKGVLLLPDILDGCINKGLNVTLTIIGEGPDEDKLKRIITEKKLIKYVTFNCFLPPSEIYSHLLNHHILLMPSFFEGLGIVVLEALACGCVPVASRLIGVTDQIINDGITGILSEPGNRHDIINAISNIFLSPSKWKEMSLAAHLWAAKQFSVEIMGEKFLNLFNNALNGAYSLHTPRRKYFPINLSLLSWRDFVPNALRKLKQHILN